MKRFVAASLLLLVGTVCFAEEQSGASLKFGKHVSAPAATEKKTPPAKQKVRKEEAVEIKAKESHKIRGMLDLNSATSQELEQLPGVGPAYAKKIISHRPYARKDELVRKKILSDEVYGKIKKHVVASEDN